MELYEKGKNVSLVSSTIQDVNDEIREALATEDDCSEDRIDVIEVKASARLRNLVPTVLHRCKSEGTKGFFAVIVGHGAAVQKVVTLGEMVSHIVFIGTRIIKQEFCRIGWNRISYNLNCNFIH